VSLTFRLLAVLLCLTALTPVQASPRIGLVLSGGGARGAAHIGVLKVLEELRIPVHAVVGTSMGSLVGGAYASGLEVQEMSQRVSAIDWGQLFTDDPPRRDWPIRRKQEVERPNWDFTVGQNNGHLRLPKGAMEGQKVQLFFADLVQGAEGASSFDDLTIPFRAVATNLENGRMHVFSSGSLAEALRASMSVPGLFSPMQIGDGLYVDGGLVRNLPVDVVRSMGVDAVIAVNLGSSYLKREQLDSVIGVAGQMIVILTEQNVERSLKELDPGNDLLIAPDLGDIGSGDFDRAAEAIAAGERAARAAAPSLRRFSVPEQEYLAWRERRQARLKAPTRQLGEVRVAGLDFVNPALFNGVRDRYQGRALDRGQLEQDLQEIYGRGDFERISYRVEPAGEERRLTVDALDKAWGPGYLQFGLGISSDHKGDNRFGLRAAYRQTWMDRMGAEWLTALTLGNEPNLFSEFYQPFDLERGRFAAAYLDLGTTPISAYWGDDRVARYDLGSYRLGADWGTTFSTVAELRAGLYFGASTMELDTGDPGLPVGTWGDSGARIRFLYDTLDSGYAPREGARLSLEYEQPLDALGADVDYRWLSLQWYGAASRGDNTLVGVLRGGADLGSRLPYYRKFAQGGFLNLSGYANDQFRGDRMLMAGLVYYRRVASLTPPLGRGLYLGGSLEYGRLWDVAAVRGIPLAEERDRFGTSLFFAADSWLGPLYLAVGLAAEGDHTVYFMLGNP
jgi:NTE family protein